MARFNHRNYRSDQLYQFSDEIRSVLAAAVPETNELLHRQVGKFSTAVSAVGLALGRELGSTFTADRNAIDATRDDLFMGFTNQIDSYLRSLNAAKKQAAELLDAAIGRRDEGRALHSLPQASNTAQLKLLFADIDGSADLTAAIATLGLAADWYDPLKQANADYEAKVIAESADEAASDETPLLKPAKFLLQERLLRILNNLEDYAEDSVQPYTDLYEQVTHLIPGVSGSAGSVPAGSEPTGSDPGGSDPGGSDPGGSDPGAPPDPTQPDA